MWRRVFAVLVVLVGSLMAAPTAGAITYDSGGLVYRVSAEQPLPARARTTKRVSCPRGTKVVSGGVVADGGIFMAVATSAPFDGDDADRKPDDGWIGAARNRSDTAYMMQTYAICARTGDFIYVKSQSFDVPSGTERTDRGVECPTQEMQVVGGGAKLSGSGDLIELASSSPSDGDDTPDIDRDDGWFVGANNESGRTQHMRVFAICSQFPIATYHTIANTLNDGTTFNSGVECPAGSIVIGGGLIMSGESPDVELVYTFPADDKDVGDVPDEVWVMAGRNGSNALGRLHPNGDLHIHPVGPFLGLVAANRLDHSVPMRLISRFLVLGFVLGGLSVLGPHAHAAEEIIVNTPKDLVDGDDGKCSLREAVTAAQAGVPSGDAEGECSPRSASDVIELKPDTTYTLTINGDTDEANNVDGDLDFTGGSVVVRGGRGTTVVQKDPDQRVIDVIGGYVILSRLKITGGQAQAPGGGPGDGLNGGGIRNSATLELSRCTVTGNRAGSAPARSSLTGGDGGGIYNAPAASLDVEDSKITNNAAGSGASGSAPFTSATEGGDGGGIYNANTATIARTKILDNRSGNGGSGSSSSTFLGDRYGADGGFGGAVATDVFLSISWSTVAGNRTGNGGNGGAGGRTFTGDGQDGGDGGIGGSGGAIHVEGSSYAYASTISGNRTGNAGLGGPGGVGDVGMASGDPGDDGHDGGGGGVLNSGLFNASNVTISGNSASVGGGIASIDDVTLNNVTIARNIATEEAGGAFRFLSGDFVLRNTLIGDNTAPTAPDCGGTFDAAEYNLVEAPAGCDGLGGTDITGVAPRLGPLDNNGGPTKTHALRNGSPAIDAGDPYEPDVAGCTPYDQRGEQRSDCDIGAYERV